MKTYRILVIYDGKPGHLSQSRGMANLIEKYSDRPCEIEVLRAVPRLKLLNRALRRFACADSAACWRLVQRFFKRLALPTVEPDLIITFGGNVISLAVALKRIWSKPCIAIGNTYGIPDSLIDAQATAFGKRCDAGSIRTLISLCKIKRDECEAKARYITGPLGPARYWTLLIGGDGSGYRFTPQDWQCLAVALENLSRQHGIRWLVSVSRRTNAAGRRLLEGVASQEYIASSIGLGFETDDCLESYLGAAERIFCTEDSLSMITEAVAMAKPVVSLCPDQARGSKTHLAILGHMDRSGLLDRVAIDNLASYQPAAFQPNQPYDEQLTQIYDTLEPLVGLTHRVERSVAGSAASASVNCRMSVARELPADRAA